MRDFDDELVAEKERTFKIGGELFEWIYPPWEIGAKTMQETFNPEGVSENGDKQFSWNEDTKYALERIPLYLNPKNDSIKRFKALVARKTDAVPRFQIVQLYKWLVQITNDLPTTPPSAELAGGGSNEEGSSAESSSTEEIPTG